MNKIENNNYWLNNELWDKHQETINDIAKKWYAPFRLNENDHKSRTLGCLLDNQRLFNDGSKWSDEFKRLSMAIVFRVFKNIYLHEMISIQPMLGPCSKVFWFDKTKNRIGEVVAVTRKLDTWIFR